MNMIDKSALVAEIERIKEDALQKKGQCKRRGLERIMHQIGAYNKILSFLDTLEVKEVDLEKIINDYFKDWKFDDELDIMVKPNNYSASFIDLKDIAKHFFELGLLSTITEEDCKLIWNIGDDLPYMPEEDFFKELLRRYKAQKGE